MPRYFKKIEPTIEYDTDNIPLDSTVKNKFKPSDTSFNTDTSNEYPKHDILDHHISFISQNVQSLRSDSQSINLDAIIEVMKKNNISIYCIQETWLDGDFVKKINGYIMFHHGLKKKL